MQQLEKSGEDVEITQPMTKTLCTKVLVFRMCVRQNRISHATNGFQRHCATCLAYFPDFARNFDSQNIYTAGDASVPACSPTLGRA